MRTFDLSPFMHSAIGFDDLLGLADRPSRLLNQPTNKTQNFPPYNIEKLDENAYQITMALAGFTTDDLNIVVEDDTLIIEGKAETQEEDETGKNFLHQGIAKRAFERRFQLADSIRVNDAAFENGLLNITLERVIPEHKKPRHIEIGKGQPKKLTRKVA